MVDKVKVADLAGPGIGSYEEVEKVLPSLYYLCTNGFIQTKSTWKLYRCPRAISIKIVI